MRIDEAFAGGRLVEQWHGLDGVYRRFDAAGVVVEERPLTADEIATLNPPPPPLTAEERLAAAVAALTEVQLLSAPVLAADVLDVLDDLRAALEG
jgi:hypothetical protein